MAIKTIVVAADGTRNLVDLHAEERLALSARGKLILPPGLKRKENLDEAALAEGEVVLVDADGATYTVFLPEGSAIEVAQATQTEFPTNPASAEPSLGTIPVNPNPNLPTNPNPNLGGAYGGAGGGASGAGVGYAITTAGILGGIGIVALAADSSDDDDDNDGGNENPTGNLPPTIVSNGGNATAFVPVLENSAAVTTVVAADPNLGDAITFSLAGGADQALFSIDPTSGALRFLTAPDFEAPSDANKDGTYEVVVQASDGVLIDTQALSVAVTDVDETEPNQAPVITTNGGLAISASTPENAVFSTKIEATDADGDAITFSLVDVLDRQYFSISQGGTLTLTAQDFENKLDSDQNGIYSVQVSASDGDATDFITVNVTVTDINEGTPGGAAPVIAGGDTAALSVAENVTAVGTVVATDADVADVVTYSLGGGADAALFVIDASTGALAFKAGQNFEAPADADGDNSYVVVVKASDGTLSDTQTVTVTVTDANDAPSITSNGGGDTAAISIEENTAAVTTVVATDVDAGDTLSYSISGGADAALFTIDAKTGALSFQNAPDSEAPADKGANNVYDVIVTASDGDASDSQAIAVSVTSTDETNTVIGGQLDGEVIEAGSSDPGTPIVSGQLTATDPDGPANSFKVSSGTATYGTFDVTEDGKWTYSLNNANTDVDALNDGGTLNDSFDVTSADGSVATIDITINGTTDVVPNQPNNTSIGGTLTGVVEEAGSANAGGKQTTTGQLTAFDPDGPDNTFASVAGATTYGSYSVNAVGLWTYSLNNSLAAVNGLQGGEILPDSFIVTALDGSTNTVNVTIQGANDNPVTDAAQAVATNEDTPLQVTVTATDVDGDTLSFTSPAASTNGGQVSGGVGGVFTYTPGQNFSGKDSFVVTVNDGNGGMAQQIITVTVSALQDDAPVITSDGGGDEGTVEVIENTTAVTTVTSKDADPGDTATYSIAGGDHATFFKIDETTGALQFWAPPSAEQGQGAGLFGNAYEVIVAATDSTGLSDTQILTVIVKNDGLGNELGEFPPQITSNGGTDEAQISIDENETVVTKVTAKESGLDLDGKADTFLYRIAGGDDAEAFTINQATGVLSFIDAPDFEADFSQDGDNEYNVIVQVSDDDGVDYQRITVVVEDVDTVFALDDTATIVEAGGIANGTPGNPPLVSGGNVLENDIDERGSDIALFVIGAKEASDAASIVVNDEPTLIQGNYGVLSIQANGEYSYELDQANKDIQALQAGVSKDETFIYTVTNSMATDAPESQAQIVVTIQGANDAPIVDLNGAGVGGTDLTTSFTEGNASGVLAASTLTTVADPDNASFESATITLRGLNGVLPNAVTETLSVDAATATTANITQTYNADTGELFLTGVNATATQFQTVLRTLRYNNSGDRFDPATLRTVSVVVNDGDLDSAPAVATINLVSTPDAPVGVADSNLLTNDPLVESGVNPGNTPASGDSFAFGNVLANDSDPDTGNNIGLAVNTIQTGATGGTAGVVGGPALIGKYGSLLIGNDGTYVYTLDNNDVDTQALVQGQSKADEVFRYTIKDGSGQLSSTATTLTFTVLGTNDAPVADSEVRNITESSGVITAPADRTGMSDNVLNGDVDPDLNQTAGLLVSAVNGQAGGVGTPVVGLFGTLVLLADGSYTYTPNAAIQSINLNQVLPDVFTYAVQDAAGAFTTSTLTINVTGESDQTVLPANATLFVDENQTAVTTVVATDLDASPGQLVYEIVGGTDQKFFDIDAVTGVLSFDPTAFDNGIGPNFEVPEDLPAAGNSYVVIVTATDPSDMGSDTQTLTVQVGNVNEAPVNAVPTGLQQVNEDADLVFSNVTANSVKVSDDDGDALTVTLTATQGLLSLSTISGLMFDFGDGTKDQSMSFSGSVTDINAALNGLTYKGNANFSGPATITVTTTDGSLTDTDVINVSVGPINDSPTLDLNGATAGKNSSGTFTEDGPAVSIVGTVDPNALLIADNDSPNLVSATVSITNLLDGAAETLSVNTAATNIVAVYNAGVLSLSGTDTLANYQQVLRTLAYSNSSQNPTAVDRNINIVVSDGTTNSNSATSVVTVVAVSDAPAFVSLAATEPSIVVTATDVDLGDTLRIATLVNNGPGMNTVNGVNAMPAGTRSITLTPIAQTTASSSTLQVSDGALSSPAFAVLVEGTNGNDTLGSGVQALPQLIYSFLGDDLITGGTGNDFIFGGAGVDKITAYNLVTGGADRINLGVETQGITVDGAMNQSDLIDMLAAGPGATQIRVSFISSEVGNGSANDGNGAPGMGQPYSPDGGFAVRLQADSADALSGNIGRTDDEGITFVAVAGTTFDVRDLVSGAQRGELFNQVVLGTQGNDNFDFSSIAAAASMNLYINAGMGVDNLLGNSGNDFLVGGAGNDLLSGGVGNDSYIGGTGDDIIIGAGPGPDPGKDTVVAYNLATDGSDQINLGTETAAITNAANNDVVNVSATGSNQIRLTFTSANVGNSVGGGSSGDGALTGSPAADTRNTVSMQAEEASGIPAGSIGYADDEGITFIAGGGATFDVRDAVSGAARGDMFDQVVLGTSFGDTYDFAAIPAAATTRYYINAGSGDDTVTGQALNDFLVGGVGNDTLTGGMGNDSYIGGAGNDTIFEGAGNDAIDGSKEAGGADLDVVVYSGNRADYTITWDGTTATVVGASTGTDTIINVGELQFADSSAYLVSAAADSEFTTIQEAVDASSDGDLILIGAGTFAGDVTVTSQGLILDGNGRAGPNATNINGQITVSGTLDSLVRVQDVAVNATGESYGVFVDAGSTGKAGSVELDNVSLANAGENGFGYIRAGNGTTPSLTDTIGSISISNSALLNNSPVNLGSGGRGDIIIFGYNGNVTLDTVDITPGAGTRIGIQIRGTQQAGDVAGTGPYAAAGNLVLNALTIHDGSYIAGGLQLSNIASFASSSITGVSFTNVSAGFGLVSSDGAGGTLDFSGVTGVNGSVSNPFEVVVQGLASADTFNGGITGDYFLNGRAGDDTLTGGNGADVIQGGAGADTINVSPVGTGEVRDVVQYATASDGAAAGASSGFDTVNGFDANGTIASDDFIQFVGTLRAALDDDTDMMLEFVASNGTDGGEQAIGGTGSEASVLLDGEVELVVGDFSQAGLVNLAAELDEEFNFSGVIAGDEHLFLINFSGTQAALVLYATVGAANDTVLASELSVLAIVNHNDGTNLGATDLGF